MKAPDIRKQVSRLIGSLWIFLALASFSFNANADGIDTSFNPQIQTSTYLNKSVRYLLPLPDGKLIASGNFNLYNNQPVGGLIRLNADATLDQTFNNELLLPAYYLRTILRQPDGKLVLVGTFNLANGLSFHNAVVRLTADGDLDPGFSPFRASAIRDVSAALDECGRVLVVVGSFVARLNNDGSFDQSFNASLSGVVDILGFGTQGNKFLYVAFDSSAEQSRLHRLSEDGAADPTFTSTLVGSYYVRDLKTQVDNKILVLSLNGLTRVNENGGVDPTLQSPALSDAKKLQLQADGRMTIDDGTGL